jgi:hypothetical protein
MTDRQLSDKEKHSLLTEQFLGQKRFDALEIHLNQEGEPSLYDLMFDELNAKISGIREIVIEQGIEINKLKAKLGVLR